MRNFLIGLALVAAVFVGGVVLTGLSVLGTYNSLVQQHEAIPGQWAQVENVLQRRNDLIPNLVETVKGYAGHERGVFADVSKALAGFNRAQTVSEKIAADNTITGLLKSIMAISLQYPNLKADEQFLRLEDEIAGTENRISVERMRYNEAVQSYNMRVKTFPTSLIAKYANLKVEETYFKADAEAQKAPKVQF